MSKHLDLSKISKWQRWLKRNIAPEMIFLQKNRIIYTVIGKVVSSKPDFFKHRDFYYYVRSTYASAASLVIMRQTDLDTQCISLARLLLNIKNNPWLITRSEYIRLNVETDHSPKRIKRSLEVSFDERFTQLDGVGEHLDPIISM